jgi:hypothetical protein
MLKYYLHRSGKIPTAVHPFVKDKAAAQANIPTINRDYQFHPTSIIRSISNSVMQAFKTIRECIAPWLS